MDSLVELRDGWWWPVQDTGCWAWVNREHDLPKRIMAHVTNFDTVIHAGANTGFYAKQYADCFKRVYAVEPENVNFHCLTRNVTARNVIRLQAALSNERKLVSVTNGEDVINCGGFWVTPGDDVLTVMIDDLIGDVGLIHLDVEAYEYFALLGGHMALSRGPVVCLETIHPDKDALAVNLLKEYGYKEAERLPHDTIFTRK